MKLSIPTGVCFWLILVACIIAVQKPGHAHDLKLARIKVRLDTTSVSVSALAHTLSLSAEEARDPGQALARRLQLRLDEKPFHADSVHVLRDARNDIVIWQATRQGAATRVTIDAPLFPEKTGESTLVTVVKNRQVVGEALVNNQQPTAQIGGMKVEAATTVNGHTAVIGQFVRLGMAHIFGGWDHILFLASLLLLGGTWRQLLKIVTAFTLAHSLTLTLAATGVFVPPARLIEPLIALSIVAVAGLNLRAIEAKKPVQLDARPWLALGFGLIHGFGFAAALTESGLARAALGWALVSFNVGVEMGQAILVMIIAPALAWLIQNRPRWREPLVFYGSTSVAVVGAFWFATRIFNG